MNGLMGYIQVELRSCRRGKEYRRERDDDKMAKNLVTYLHSVENIDPLELRAMAVKMVDVSCHPITNIPSADTDMQ